MSLSVLCPPFPATVLSRGPWSKKAKPFLISCVPDVHPGPQQVWLLEQEWAPRALQTPRQRQQTLGRCMEKHLRAALGDEGLVWPRTERCLLLLKYLQEILPPASMDGKCFGAPGL